MSLSADEYREHLSTTAVRAGFSFDDVVLPQGHYAQVGGMRLHYLDWGNKHLPPLLFLHGGALTAHTWDLVCLALRDEYHCLALDQRGHGDSDWSEDADYTMGAQLTDTFGAAPSCSSPTSVMICSACSWPSSESITVCCLRSTQ